MTRGIVLLALSIVFQGASLAFGKRAAIGMPEYTLTNIAANHNYLLSLAALTLQAICWQLTLARFPLSFAYASMSIVYVITLLLSAMMFHEPVHVQHAAAVVLIMSGVVLVGRGRARA